MRTRLGWAGPVLLSVALLVSGCAQGGAYRIPARTVHVSQQSGGAAAAALEQRHCIAGVPQFTDAAVVGPTVRLHRSGYIAEHSSADKIALWVASHLRGADMAGDHGRPASEPFKADPDLAAGGHPRAELSDYRNSGYSRGHQSPSADFLRGSTAQAETYYLSNMTPQWQSLNGGVWAQLEKQVREWAASHDEVWVITGPMFWEDEEDDPNTADGVVWVTTIGQGMTVPTHYFKIVVRSDGSGQPDDMIAFVMPNLQKMPSGTKPAEYRTSVRWIEDRTGIDFMPDARTPKQQQLETAVAPMWTTP